MKKITKQMNYTTSEVNKNFRIKVCGVDENGKYINKLVGVAGSIELVGVELLNKFLSRAFSCLDDVCVCKLRRGLKFSFYVK